MDKKFGMIEWAIKYKAFPLSLAFILCAVGLYALVNMPRNEFPDFTVKQALVVGIYPGASAGLVEKQVTKKVEEYIFGFNEVNKIKSYSYSRDGIMYMFVEVDDRIGNDETGIFWNKIKNGLFVLKAQMPEEVLGLIVNSDFGNTSSVLMAIESDQRGYKSLEHNAKLIEDRLRSIPTLAKIQRIGALNEQISVTVHKEKLLQYGLTGGDVIQSLQNIGGVYAIGSQEGPFINRPIHLSSSFTSEAELASLTIKNELSGNVLRLRDVAEIKREYGEPSSEIYSNGTRAILLSMEMASGNNIVHFGEEVDKKLAEVRMALPEDIRVNVLANQPHVVNESISHFMKEFLYALIGVVVVTLLLLPFRVASVAAATIPITIACTLAIMYMFGMDLNTVTLASLVVVLGIVVDDPIVVIDNHIEQLDKGLSVWDAARKSAAELFPSVFTATLAIIATFGPLTFFMKGVAKDFISLFPAVVAIALSLSLIVSMLLVPYFNTLFIKKGLHHAEGAGENNSLLGKLDRVFGKYILKAINNPGMTIGIGVFSVVVGGLIMANLPQQLFPKVERDQFAMEVYLPSGTNLAQTDSLVKDIERYLAKDERIKGYTSFIGTSSPRFHTVYSPNLPASNYAQILLNTKDEHTTEVLLKEYEMKMGNLYPGGYVRMKQLNMVPSAAPIEFRVYGDDIATMRDIAEQIKEFGKGHPSITWIRDDYQEALQTLGLEINYEELSRVGLTKKDLSNFIAMNMNGVNATQIWEDDYALTVQVKSNLPKSDLSQLMSMGIPVPQARTTVPLHQIASLKPEWSPGQIVRRNGVKTLTVLMDTKKDAVPSNVFNTLKPHVDNIELPGNVTVGYAGEQELMDENVPPMALAMLVSVVTIFLILLWHFKFIKHALLSLATMPLCILGAAFGLWAMDYPVGFTAFVGLLALCGIVVRNGLILIDFAEYLRHKEGLNVKEAAILASKRRMRPIFLTSSAAAIGVVPMVISRSSLWGPLGTTICFGLLTSMVLTLFVLPTLYWVFFGSDDEKGSLGAKSETSRIGKVFGWGMKKSTLVAVVLLIGTASVMNGQDLTLQKSIEAAEKHNVRVKNAQLDVRIAGYDVKSAKTAYLPQVQGLGIAIYGFNDFIEAMPPLVAEPINSFYFAGVSASQPLYVGGKIRFSNDLAHLQSEVNKIIASQSIDSARLITETKFWNIVNLYEQAKVLDESMKLIRQVEKQQKELLDAGFIIRNDLLKVEVQKSRLLMNESQVQNGIKISLLDFCLYTGIAYSDSLKLFYDLEGTVAGTDLGDNSLENNKNIQLLERNVEAAVLQAKLKRSELLPQVSLGVNAGYIGAFNGAIDNRTFPVVLAIVNVPISEWWASGGNNYKKQKLETIKAENMLQYTAKQVELGIIKARLDLMDANKEISFAEKNLEQAKENLKVSDDNYWAGFSTVTELMDAQTLYREALSNRAMALAKYRIKLAEFLFLREG